MNLKKINNAKISGHFVTFLKKIPCLLILCGFRAIFEFFVAGPEEEKLLGSILLPSYRVTACKPEDKVNKKFAFKAEHANMRTYHFAAETRENMNQWVNALTLASLLQDPNP